MTAFSSVVKGAPDPMQDLKKITDIDCDPHKVDLGAGVYRNEQGQYHEFYALKKAKAMLYRKNPDHDISIYSHRYSPLLTKPHYYPTTGIPAFREAAAKLLFGDKSPVIAEARIASVQTVAGTGANRIGAAFLRRHLCAVNGSLPVVYVGSPAWGNYRPMFENAGFEVRSFRHSSRSQTEPDIDSILQTIAAANAGSIFILQGCCNNPTGLDYGENQWRAIAKALLERHHFAFLDIAYQGFGSSEADGLDNDAFAIRHFAEIGVNLLAAQSFSKNMGLYNERVGALHVVCKTSDNAENVFDQLRLQIRWEFSSAPAYGARLVETILNDIALRQEWHTELRQAATRIETNRKELYHLLTKRHKTPGQWEHILSEKGLFSYLDLNECQVKQLVQKHHIYLPPSGRINLAGLSQMNIERTAAAINCVVTGFR